MPETLFDLVILTAANERQADGFRLQLEWRLKNSELPAATEFTVLADPHGKRIGSGGSTFLVLDHLLQSAKGDPHRAFHNRRILVLHSGGDSRRLPAYSPLGKIFAPLPSERYRALFDVMLETYARLPVDDQGQVIVTSGDVLLDFDPQRIAFSPQGITGVAYPDDPAAAAGYGVFVVRENPSAGQPLPVADFLQKPDLAELNRAGAIDPGYRVWIDTGILNFSPDAAQSLVGCRDLIDAYRSGQRNHNLYHEILFALLGKGELAEHASLRQIDFSTVLLPYCGFFHIGRSRELLQNYFTLTSAAALCDFRNCSRSNGRTFPHLKNSFIYNTLITTPDVRITGPAVMCITPRGGFKMTYSSANVTQTLLYHSPPLSRYFVAPVE